MHEHKLSIIIPVFNEVNTVLKIFKAIKQQKNILEIIVVDDASTDGTKELLQKVEDDKIKIIFNQKNRGKGFCIRQAVEKVKGDIVIIQDADLEYYPDEYPLLIEKILEDKADVVFGTRFMGAHRAFLFYHFLGNQLINFIANLILNAYVTDLMTCYKAFKLEAFKSLALKADRFGIEPEITAEVFRRGYRVYEVPISYDGRTQAEGKKIKWTDFFVCIFWLIKASLRPIQK